MSIEGERKTIQILRGRPIFILVQTKTRFHLWTSIALNEGAFILSSKFCNGHQAKQESTNQLKVVDLSFHHLYGKIIIYIHYIKIK